MKYKVIIQIIKIWHFKLKKGFCIQYWDEEWDHIVWKRVSDQNFNFHFIQIKIKIIIFLFYFSS